MTYNCRKLGFSDWRTLEDVYDKGEKSYSNGEESGDLQCKCKDLVVVQRENTSVESKSGNPQSDTHIVDHISGVEKLQPQGDIVARNVIKMFSKSDRYPVYCKCTLTDCEKL